MDQRTVGWFSCGAASAVAMLISMPDVIAYCNTGSEDVDNKRFMRDCENLFGKKITILKNEKYQDTWDVWEKEKWLSGVAGARCTAELKVEPRLMFQRPNDIHVFGYTADANDVGRAKRLRANWPDLNISTPLIDRGIKKSHCLAMLEHAGIKPPRVYELGFPNANCIPCVKAQSPSYWALVRKEYPEEFNRMVTLSRKLGVRLAKTGEERLFIDEIPLDQEVTKAIAPECDFLCSLAEQEFG